MNDELARKLLFLVNNLEAMKALEAYLEHRIEYNRDQLEYQSTNPSEHRGALFELRRFKTLRDEVLSVLEKKNG